MSSDSEEGRAGSTVCGSQTSLASLPSQQRNPICGAFLQFCSGCKKVGVAPCCRNDLPFELTEQRMQRRSQHHSPAAHRVLQPQETFTMTPLDQWAQHSC